MRNGTRATLNVKRSLLLCRKELGGARRARVQDVRVYVFIIMTGGLFRRGWTHTRSED